MAILQSKDTKMSGHNVIDISVPQQLKQLEKDLDEAVKTEELLRVKERQERDIETELHFLWTQAPRGEKTQRKKELDAAKIRADLTLGDLKIQQTRCEQMRKDIIAFKVGLTDEYKAESTVKNVVTALENLNANYVASDSKWYCIYTNDCRYQPQVRIISNDTMKDLILRETGWVETQDITIKKIAREHGRMYRDVERTFRPAKEGVLNQMDELRKFWLKPVFGQPHHIAFDILISNLVDGDEAYKAQIEKYIAYRYVKPHDIYAPSIDSSAKGGAGRDTIFRLLEIIFTEECCGEANGETFNGTHNGELWGKVWIKISERNARTIDYNEFKNLTGGNNFRLRRMGENAIQSPRTFIFFIMNNGYNGTITLAGTGKGAEDRRVEPVISNTSLRTRIAEYLGVDENSEIVGDTIQDWQDNIWQNETEIARWLGNIIDQHKPDSITKITPLHAQYYAEMFSRQKNAFNTFMENIVALANETNCFVVDDMYKIYKIATLQSIDKNSFAKRMAAWLTQQSGQNWQVKVRDIYYDVDDGPEDRHRKSVVYVPEQVTPGSHESKQVFNIFEFIDEDKRDDKGNDLGRRPHTNNIKGELL
jgi:hypothetical protein